MPALEKHGSGRSFAQRLAWGLVAFDLLLVVFASWTLVLSRGQYIERAKVTTYNLTQVLEQNILGMVNQIDLALLAVKDVAERREPPDLEQRIHASIRAQVSRVRILDTLRTVDAQGFVNHDSEVTLGQRIGVQDRDYFQYLKAHPGSGLFISRPALGRINRKWVVFFARRLEQQGGQFAGIVYGTVTIDSLVNTLSKVDVGQRGSISLRGSNLELLARFPRSPGDDQHIGNTTIMGDYLEAVQAKRPVSHFTTASGIDGQVRTYTLQRMDNPVVYILVGLAEKDYFQAWWREALLSSSAVIGIIALSCAVAWMAHAAWNRQMTSQAERDRLISDLTRALDEVKSLEGLLPICGSCKKIRDDRGYWNQLETYISDHTDATFTHGVCPDCAETLRREWRDRRNSERRDPGDAD